MYTEKKQNHSIRFQTHFIASYGFSMSVLAATTTTAEVTAFHTLLLYVVYKTMLASFLSSPEIAIFVSVGSIYKETPDYDKFFEI